jgi:DNA-binding NtrC family response regulator
MAKIVLIEDDDIARRFYAGILTKKGYEVIDFPDAAPALENCAFEEMDLIITDLEMPTGAEELIKTVRSRGIETPILVISGHLGDGRSEQLKEIGAQATLTKPFKFEGFFKLVQDLI